MIALRFLDWLWVLMVCRIFRQHMWIWREAIRVPFYGAWECADCKKVKVRP